MVKSSRKIIALKTHIQARCTYFIENKDQAPFVTSSHSGTFWNIFFSFFSGVGGWGEARQWGLGWVHINIQRLCFRKFDTAVYSGHIWILFVNVLLLFVFLFCKWTKNANVPEQFEQCHSVTSLLFKRNQTLFFLVIHQQREAAAVRRSKGAMIRFRLQSRNLCRLFLIRGEQREWTSHYLVTEPLNTATV